MVALFVIATILLFVVADAIVAYFKRRESTVAEAKPVLQPQGMPAGLFVDAHHAWISLTAEGKVRVGLDELARKLTGAIDSVRFAETGKRIARGETLMWVKAGNITVPVVSPVSGIVEATQLPDPNAKGTDAGAWLVSMKPERLGFEIRALRVAEEAAAWMKGEFRRLTESLHGLRAATAGAVPDGGEPADGLLRELDRDERDTIVRDFLTKAE
jgi:glycine cleavage system H lipoate-binding protein